MTMPLIKKHYEKSARVSFKTTGPSLTHQSMTDECDINQIMQRWQKTGIIEHRNTYEGQYADFTNTPADYHESMNAVLKADEMFGTLPSSVRRRFHNDPGNFLEFVADPNNSDELIKMGLAKAVPLEVIETPTATPKAAPKASPEPPKGEKSDKD